jgi:hypothetical protein
MLNKPLMGTPIKVSAFAAIMSYRRGTTCLFPNIGWDGAKTSIALAPLPVMGEGEDQLFFTERWLTKFIEILTGMLKIPPQNLRRRCGFWRGTHL